MTLQASRLAICRGCAAPYLGYRTRPDLHPERQLAHVDCVIILVLEFGSSSALAAAYGIAVSGTMIITTLLTAVVALSLPGRARLGLMLALILFGALEILFFGSN